MNFIGCEGARETIEALQMSVNAEQHNWAT